MDSVLFTLSTAVLYRMWHLRWCSCRLTFSRRAADKMALPTTAVSLESRSLRNLEWFTCGL